MKAPIFLSIVMPAYNEQPHIEAVIREHLDTITHLVDSLDDWEILCLDDGSQDSTAAVVGRLSERVEKVRLLKHGENRGIYQSQTDLYVNARGTHIYFTGSDGQWPASNLLKMFTALQAGADLVVGVRQNRSEVYSLRRQIVSHVFNLLPKLLFGFATRDAGSVKLGVREVFTCDVISRSPFADAERMIRAYKRGCRIEFIPIDFLPRTHGKAKGATLRNVVASLRDCFKLVGHMKRHETFEPIVPGQARNGS